MAQAMSSTPRRTMKKILAIKIDPSTKDETVQLDCSEIEQIIRNPGCHNRPLVVVGVNGKKRTGKSFMVNIMMNYLEQLEQGPERIGPWLNSNPVIAGVDWKQSPISVTKGIWMSERPYVIEPQRGTKVAVLLMDCQGLFDETNMNSALMDHCITLCSLKMCTIHLLRVDGYLNDADTQNLSASLTYAANRKVKMDFQNLLIVHKDWPGESPDLGLQRDGFQYLKKERQLSESEKIIQQKFSNIMAFMSPEPGKKVKKGNSEQGMSLQDMLTDEDSKEFFRYMQKLLRHLFTEFASDGQYTTNQEKLLKAMQALANTYKDKESYLKLCTAAEQIDCESVKAFFKNEVAKYLSDKADEMKPTSYESEAELNYAIDCYEEEAKKMVTEDKNKRGPVTDESAKAWSEGEQQLESRIKAVREQKLDAFNKHFKEQFGKKVGGTAGGAISVGTLVGLAGGPIGMGIGAAAGAVVTGVSAIAVAVQKIGKESKGKQIVAALKKEKKEEIQVEML